jgi:glycosyltransferase involved in cell wall biosynthesis
MNVVGHFRGEFGVAEASRSLVTAARAGGVDVALVAAGTIHASGGDLRLADEIGSVAPHPINVLGVNANDTVALLDDLGPGITDGRYAIGFWFWELAGFPSVWLPAVDAVDEVWVASGFVRDAVAAITSKPVTNVRLAVDATPSRPYTRAEFDLPDDPFVFLFTFSFNSYVARKNPDGVVDAFRAAFPAGDRRAFLLMKSMNGDKAPHLMAALEEAVAGDGRIRLLDGSMGRDAVFGLESVCDSYVSLHRSEGFGLGLAESMALGKPVIGTAYSGNLEFMDETTSLLVDHRLVPVGPREYPFPEGQVWADPDVEAAARHMRRLVEDRAFARDLGARAAARMRDEFSAAAVGAGIARRVGAILDGRASGA